MPYQWLPADPDGEMLRLWPYRSLPRRGFVWFIGLTCVLITLPLLAVLGGPHLWVLLPFLAAAVAGVWWALERSYRDAQVREDLAIRPGRVTLTRHGPGRRHHEWEADPHWLRVERHETSGPVPEYLTLSGGARVVELGRFLTPEERKSLEWELRQKLRALRGPR